MRLPRAVLAILLAGLLLPNPPLTGATHSEGRDVRLLPRDRMRAVVYVALGDSGASGTGASRPELGYAGRVYARLKDLYPAARMVNLAVRGADSLYVLNYEVPRAADLRPDLVTLSFGGKDVLLQKDVRQFERHVETIFRTLNAKTGAVIVMNRIGDMGLWPGYVALYKGGGEAAATELSAQVVRFNEALERLAHVHGVELVGGGEERRYMSRAKELIARDGLHPSDEGHAIWAEIVWGGVKARLP